MEIRFKADRIFLKPLRSDRSFRVEIDTGEYEAEAMKEILTLPEGIYEISITPVVE